MRTGIVRTHGFGLVAAAAVVLLLVGQGRGTAATGLAPVSSEDPGPDVRAMQLLSPTQGWALTWQRLAWTDDGGERWADITPAGVLAGNISGVFFLDTEHGWAVVLSQPDWVNVQSLLVLRTADGGRSWQAATLASLKDLYGWWGAPASLSFVDRQHGWIVEPHLSSSNVRIGDLFQTTDGGASWVRRGQIPEGGAIQFTSPSEGWSAAGPWTGQLHGTDQLYVTRDGGNSWERRLVEPAPGLAPGRPAYGLPVFTSAGHGMLPVTFTGEPAGVAFYTTEDGGTSWTLAASVVSRRPMSIAVLVPTAIIDERTWVLAMWDPGGKHVLRTRDGGKTWESAAPDGRPLDLAFATAEVGWGLADVPRCGHGPVPACSTHVQLHRTTDGGRTWTRLSP